MGFHLTLPLDAEACREFARRVKALFEDFQARGSDCAGRPARLLGRFDPLSRHDGRKEEDGCDYGK